MRLPDFLVIGAMKSGTTSLYHDLASNPLIYLAEKEGSHLTRETSLEEYGRNFVRAGSDQICGDVSTHYAMLPDHKGVIQRSRKLLPEVAKLIYLVREPVSRAVSHHHHCHSQRGPKRMSADFDACVRQHPCLTNYGCYATQYTPWLRAWGEDAIRLIRFEDYVRDRRGTIAHLCEFLGVPPRPELVPVGRIINASDGKPVVNDFWDRARRSLGYRRLVRPCLSLAARDWVRGKLLPAAPPRPAPPSPKTIDRLLASFLPEAQELRSMTGRSEPYWDLDRVREEHLKRFDLWRDRPRQEGRGGVCQDAA